MKRTSGFNEMETPSGGQKLEDQVGLLKLGTSPEAVRFIGEPIGYSVHWIELESEREDGKTSAVPRMALKDDDPYLEIADRTSVHAYCNVIVRGEQKKKPLVPSGREKKAGHLIKGESTTPVMVVRLPMGVVRTLKEISRDFNKGIDVTDPEKGMDIHIKYDSKSNSPSTMYSVHRGDRTKLTKTEREYLLWPLDSLFESKSLKEAKKDVAELRKRRPAEDEGKQKGPKKGKGKKKKGGKK